MDAEQRIAQFRKLITEDPANDIAHFSLGSALAQTRRHREAATSFERTIALNPNMSKAYQLAAEQYIATGDTDKALALMKRGYETATLQGDMLPKRAIADLFTQLGHPIPDITDKPAVNIPEGAFLCARTGRPGTQLERPPFKGPLGQWIQTNISAETWNDWIRQGTMVINELRLDLSRDEDSRTYDEHMHKFLGLSPAQIESMSR